MSIIGAAMMLLAFTLIMYFILGAAAWKVIQLIFGWGKRVCNWTKYPNVNGILFVLIILFGWLLISYTFGGVNYPEVVGPNRVPPLGPWDKLFRGMFYSIAIAIDLGLVALALFVIYHLIRGLISWLFDSKG